MTSTPAGPGLSEERCRRLENQISALKQVSSLRKNLLGLRERQAKDLISKLKFYEVIVDEERATRHSLSARLENAETQCGQLTERLQKNLHTIDELKTNYENKVSTLINEVQTSAQRTQQLSDQLNCAQLRISEVTKDLTMEELTRKLEEVSRSLEEKDRLSKEMQKQLKRVWERNKVLSYQMSLLNNLFSETEGVTIDFEKIKAIGDIVRESQSYAEETEEVLSDEEFSERSGPAVDLENLLDTFEQSENVIPADIPGEESCYKSIDTKRGPQLVLSVSRTFIKLKDLIVEKKALQKEIETLKTLNTKLDSKVDKQEHRLYRVTMELNKTWSLVSKLKQQHKRLYNSEAVLRYELQEKRALLEKLKIELSTTREKWRRVRQKNSASQVEWEKLRDEFAQRRPHQSSQESGTFSEVMSGSSSGENEPVEDEDAPGYKDGRGNKLEKSKTLPMSFTTVVSTTNDTDSAVESAPTPANLEAAETEMETIDGQERGGDEEDIDDGGASALSPLEDDTSEDPLEEMVSQLVEDIDNEADTEEDSRCSSSSKTQLEVDSSPSPDFEDRMRRRANRLQMLEEQCHILHKKLLTSTERSVALSTKLAELHDHYGPSGSSSTSTGTPSDKQPKKQQGDHQTSSQTENDATVVATHSSQEVCSSSNEDTVVSQTSTDTAYVSGPESSSIQEEGKLEILNESDERGNQDVIEAKCSSNEIGSKLEKENASTIVASSTESESSTTSCQENNQNLTATTEEVKAKKEEVRTQEEPQSQGHSPNVLVDNTLLTTVKDNSKQSSSVSVAEGDSAAVSTDACTNLEETVADDESTSPPVAPITQKDELSSMPSLSIVNSPEESSSSRDAEETHHPSFSQPEENNGNVELSPLICDVVANVESLEESTRSQQQQQHNQESDDATTPATVSNSQGSLIYVAAGADDGQTSSTICTVATVEIQEASQSQVPEDSLSTEEDPVPIIQETVVQHFPTSSEEEANEFAPVQIRPEFLRILQEADEATNASSLDWMPSLLTITHSVALLRLDREESPDSSVTRNNNNSRSLSESLRIEIPRQSASPPPAHQQQRRQQVGNEGSSGTNQNDHGHLSTEEETESTERPTPQQRKDPSFLSRMIIKQLPKRLQLLKNENHTLQMEAAEANMRMKEMKRQLTKELEKQQQLANSLDTQIEDKNLIEFELREELEQKEKVIEELQMEIDESKKYIDELKKEKEDVEAFMKVFVEEKVDLNEPKVSPETVKNCNNCKRPFLLLTRRKLHCKICGKIFCKDCALPREPNKRSSKRPRLCTHCHLRRLRLVVLVNASKKQPTA